MSGGRRPAFPTARVVFLVLDGLPASDVSAELTPNLVALAAEAGHAPGRARGLLPAATYPNHATFATGAVPSEHGLVANWLPVEGTIRRADDVGPRVRTLFDACAAAGVRSALVAGDQCLVGVMGGGKAATHWPPDGHPPPGAALDAHGYLTDDETRPHLLEALAGEAPLVLAQLNGPDTAGHVHGPGAPETRDAARVADAAVGEMRAELGSAWRDTVLVVVSDHAMEPVTNPDPIELHRHAPDGLVCIPGGSAAVVHGRDPEAGAWIGAVPGVDGHQPLTDTARIVNASPGRYFGFADLVPFEPGTHGGPRTLDQVAVVGGGHPAARALAADVARGDWHATHWAPALAELIGVPW